MPPPSEVSLNFFPLDPEAFKFKVYRIPYAHELTVLSGTRDEAVYKHHLPRSAGSTVADTAGEYHVSFAPVEGFEEFTCDSSTNPYVTCRLLFDVLAAKCKSSLPEESYSIDERFDRRVYFVLETHDVGESTVWLSPYYLRSQQLFGFLSDFKFRRSPDAPFDRRILQLSLSLDKQFRDNPNSYVDRYEQLARFLKEVSPKVFPITLRDGTAIGIQRGLVRLRAHSLGVKTYLFSDDNSSKSQFMGVREHGPLRRAGDDVLLYFVYRPGDKAFSHDLYRALRGDTYATFPGMERVFGYSLGKEHVAGVPLDDFTGASYNTVINQIKASADERSIVPVVLVPWTRHDEEFVSEEYYRFKHVFLRSSLPSQFVSLKTIQDKRTFKWSIANIALGIFSKMGGYPWKVQPQNEKCLIVGIGQSHRLSDEVGRTRYFAYSVLADSSGIYDDLRVLSRSKDEEDYLQRLSDNLRKVFVAYADRFDKFAIHTTFAIRHQEMDAIERAIDAFQGEAAREKEFVVLKFNDRSRFFGYQESSNSMVPYESTALQLSSREYLVWFEGLQYHNPNVRGKVARPVHVKFLHPRERELSSDVRWSYLQDALNLSGANWRGFNAKTLPISVYYAQLVARYLREFDRLGLAEIELENLTPWFL